MRFTTAITAGRAVSNLRPRSSSTGADAPRPVVVAGFASAITGQASASRLLYGMGRDRLLPHRIFGYVHPRLGTPIYSVLLMGGLHLLGALLLKYTEAAELVNFGAFGFADWVYEDIGWAK